MKDHKILLKCRLLLIRDENVLLMHQTSGNGGNFTLPGGTVEDNEFSKLALVREVLEETGILVDWNSLQLVHVLHKKKGLNSRVVLYFRAEQWLGRPVSRELDKFRAVRWFDLNNLPKAVSPTVRFVIEQFLDKKMYSEYSKG